MTNTTQTLADIIRAARSNNLTRNQLKVARAKLRRYGVSGAGRPGGQGGPLIPVASNLESAVVTALNA